MTERPSQDAIQTMLLTLNTTYDALQMVKDANQRQTYERVIEECKQWFTKHHYRCGLVYGQYVAQPQGV